MIMGSDSFSMSAPRPKTKKVSGRIDCYNTASTKPVDFSFLSLENVTGLITFIYTLITQI